MTIPRIEAVGIVLAMLGLFVWDRLRFDLVAPAVGRAITRSGIIDLALQRVLRCLTSPLILWSWPL